MINLKYDAAPLTKWAKHLISNPLYIRRVALDKEINTDYDIPYVAGYSTDGKTIYIDRHLPLKMGNIDIVPYLLMHEMIEKALIDLYKLHYQEAHKIASVLEKNMVEEHKINFARYKKFFIPYIKKIGNARLTKIPKDLDLTPYMDNQNFKQLQNLKKAMK
jgi:hypothetical protein